MQDPEHAKRLSHKDIYTDATRLSAVALKKLKETEQNAEGLEGYLVYDRQNKKEGKIISIQEFPGQWMAEIELESSKYQIPIHSDFIVQINEKKKHITLDLPEGIWDL